MNIIHPTAVIGENCELGDNNYIGPYCVLEHCHIGDNNRFERFVSIGSPPEHKGLHLSGSNLYVVIGNNCVFKEFVTINRGTVADTKIGDEVWFLRGSHGGHDSVVESKATISCSAIIGGHSIIMEGANLGLSAIIRQKLVVGPYAMVGMNSTVTKNIYPFKTVWGSPAEHKEVNELGMKRANFTREEIDSLMRLDKNFSERVSLLMLRYNERLGQIGSEY